MAEGDGLADERAVLELVLEELRGEGRAVGERPTSLARSMMTRCPRGSMKPASPVWNQPSGSMTSRVASSFLR